MRLRAGLEDLRGLRASPPRGLGWVMHKSTAVRERPAIRFSGRGVLQRRTPRVLDVALGGREVGHVCYALDRLARDSRDQLGEPGDRAPKHGRALGAVSKAHGYLQARERVLPDLERLPILELVEERGSVLNEDRPPLGR
jgi:hypothetical protein